MVNWNLIRSNGRKVSSAKIRKSIVSFMTKHHPCSVVKSIEKKYNAYKIHLLNGICLIFDADGRFVKMN
ncbi:PepSY-like domain-containing protein [Chryseobacterium sp.]|uniref:PepSY-like domain-containing protein n=1 Tax=unclassified Chryseobacterium TaxID=2593645 RepID=UPI00260A2DEE|nr:PepSY-like domain-containing protein [Chryseobacterium sp.]